MTGTGCATALPTRLTATGCATALPLQRGSPHCVWPSQVSLVGGFVLSPVHNRLTCVYGGDANTNKADNGGCGRSWCHWPGYPRNCATRPADLKYPLESMQSNDRAGINELGFDRATFDRQPVEMAVVAAPHSQLTTREALAPVGPSHSRGAAEPPSVLAAAVVLPLKPGKLAASPHTFYT